LEGWIKLHRQLLGSDTFQNEKLLKAFIYCMLKATHKEHEQLVGKKKVLLKPGQFIWGRHKSSEELNMKESTAWSYIKILEDLETIVIRSNNKFSIISIVNWGLYQSESKISDSENNNKKTTNEQQKDTNKNDKNNLSYLYNKDPLEDTSSEAYKKLKAISDSIFK